MTTPNPTNMKDTTWEQRFDRLWPNQTKSREDLMALFGNEYKPHTATEAAILEQAENKRQGFKDFIRKELSLAEARGELRGREEEKARILACGHAHEPIHGFQPYGLMDEEKERAIFEDGFKDGRAMLMIDVMSKRNPTPSHKGEE